MFRLLKLFVIFEILSAIYTYKSTLDYESCEFIPNMFRMTMTLDCREFKEKKNRISEILQFKLFVHLHSDNNTEQKLQHYKRGKFLESANQLVRPFV
jgi:hypothetical protein